MSVETDVVDAQLEAFSDSPDLEVTIGARITSGAFVIDEEHLSGLHLGDMATAMTSVAVYRISQGKIAKLMILS